MDSKWKTEALSKAYLEGVREAIPSAKTQIEIILKIISMWNPDIKTVMDLGCGDGVLGCAILDQYPSTQVCFVDFSEPMLEAARKKITPNSSVKFIKADYSCLEWKDVFEKPERYDLVVSGFSIHHQSHDRKKEVYQEVYDLLNPGGTFLNLEHVSSPNNSIEAVFDDYFIDHLYRFHSGNDPQLKRKEIADQYYNRPDKAENILAPVQTQCDWLKKIGYQDVDCFFKVFELALFGGRKAHIV